MLVACDPLGFSPNTSALRESFECFLHGPSVWNLLGGLTHVSDDLSWWRYAPSGRVHNEAVLVSDREQAEAPVASAMLNLSEAVMARYGHDSRCAELVLHIEPRDEEGEPARGCRLDSVV
jgi:hypothetical protein